MATKTKHRVLIVGGGFGGVKAALDLADDESFAVQLITLDDELRYYPTLYRTATGGRRANSSIPLKTIFLGKQVDVVEDEATTLDRQKRLVNGKSGQVYPYDSLILALGVVTNYFNIPGLQDFAFSIKSQSEVERFKEHLHSQVVHDGKPDLNYVIVGAGPTGIELAGSLPGYLRHIFVNHGIKQRAVHIDLIEAAPKLLPRLPKDASRAVRRRLKRLGIRVYTKAMVQGETADSLTVNGRPISSHTVIWTAGVMNHPFFTANQFTLMKSGKVAVDVYLQAENNIFVIGDNANTPYSGLAQTALYDGSFVAENLKRQQSGKDMESYQTRKPTTVIPAGPYWAAVIRGRLRLYGFVGWLIRETAELVGFKELEPWGRAAKQWLTEFGTQDNCPVCAIAETSKAR